MQKIKYITNRELLAEIQRSKATFCHFSAPEYATYDAVVTSLEALTPELLENTRQLKIARAQKANPDEPVEDAEVVFRVMSDGHLPPETDEKRRKKSSTGEWVAKPNFPPFKHYVVRQGGPIEVGRSHWKGDLETGGFCISHGKVSRRLAEMYMLLVEQYSRRGNWRGYCCSEDTEALTQRGWLGINDITEDDIILSYNEGKLVWSKIKSIFKDEYEGKMFHLTVDGMDALVTPGHRFVTTEGLVRIEYLQETNEIVLTEGRSVPVSGLDFHDGKRTGDLDEPHEPTADYKGRVWCPETEYGCFMARRNGTMYLTGNSYRDEMCCHALVQLSQVGLQFDESRSDNPFAWYTQIVKNSFRRVLLLERRNQDIRDDLLIISGAAPSSTRQVDNELDQKEELDGRKLDGTTNIADSPKKRGRKPKVN